MRALSTSGIYFEIQCADVSKINSFKKEKSRLS